VFATGGPLSLYGGFNNRGRIDLFNNTTGLAIDFQGNGSSRMQLYSNGNLLIGTTTDTGHKLLVSGSGASGSVNLDNTLYVTGSRIGVGTNSPTTALDVVGTIKGTYVNTALVYGSGDLDLAAAGGSTGILIKSATRNVLLNTIVDSGYKFDVNGTVRVKGTGTSGTDAFTVQDNTGVQIFNVNDLGQIQIGKTTAINWTFSSNSLISTQYAFIISTDLLFLSPLKDDS
jgi:hypothetical protein